MRKIICLIGLIIIPFKPFVNALDQVDSSRGLLENGNILITEWGSNQVTEFDNTGNIVWQITVLNIPHDAERLENGNTLITAFGDQVVVEFDKDGNEVWKKSGLNLPMNAERLSNGNTLITEYGGGSVIEVDITGNIVWQINNLHKPHDSQRLYNNNTLIAEAEVFPEGRVIEVDLAGNIVWQITGLNGSVDAERLNNGNTLITEHVGKRVIEVDYECNIVWEKTGLYAPKDAERLPNGNTLIVECGGNRVIEVDTNGNIVWELNGLNYPVDAEVLTNQPPYKPAKPSGPTKGKPGISYTFETSTSDPEKNQVYYFFDFGDNNSTGWIGPFNSSTVAYASHKWTTKGNFYIKVKAKDSNGAESNWSDPLSVSMPRSIIFKSLFIKFIRQFPLLERLLKT
jgi:hypothetical protein